MYATNSTIFNQKQKTKNTNTNTPDTSEYFESHSQLTDFHSNSSLVFECGSPNSENWDVNCNKKLHKVHIIAIYHT